MARLYMQGLHRILNISEYGSYPLIMPETPQCTLMFFNMTREIIRITKANKLLKTFLFDYNDVRAFEVFK